MVSIRDVAIHAGVSVTTVSRVLNNHPYVSEEKRISVLSAIEKLDYTPNYLAINLSRGSSKTIAIVLPYISNPYYFKILEGAIQNAKENDYYVIVIETQYELDEELRALEMLKHKLIEGIIFTTRHISLDILDDYRVFGNIILMEKQDKFKYVFINQFNALLDAMNYLIDKGYNKIGYTVHRLKGFSTSERMRAYNSLDTKHTSPDFIYSGYLSILDGKQLAHEWMASENKPDALIVTNDAVSSGLYATLKKQGIKIPEDIAIISYENGELSTINELTSVHIPLVEMGYESVSLALKNRESSICVNHQIIERYTT